MSSKLIFVVFFNPFLHTKNDLKKNYTISYQHAKIFEKKYAYQIIYGVNK